MESRLACTIALVSLALSGCQNSSTPDPSNDDWIVGTWTSSNICGNDDVEVFRQDGVHVGHYNVGAWRLRGSQLTITTLYDENEFNDSIVKSSGVRIYYIKSHEGNRSMIISGDGRSSNEIRWINCANPSIQNEYGVKFESTEASPPLAPSDSPAPAPAPVANAANAPSTAAADPQTPLSEELTCRGYLYDDDGGLGLMLKLNQRGDWINSNEACNAYIEYSVPAFRERVLSVCRVGSPCTIRGRVGTSYRGNYNWWQSIEDVRAQ